VYRRNVSYVYAFFCFSVDADTAQDLTAATFERLVRSWRRFDPSRSSLRSWLLVIARNLLTDHFRQQKFRVASSLDEHPEVAALLVAHDDPAAQRASVEGLKAWLVELRPREREVLALRFGADLTTHEISASLGMTEAAVHQTSSRALRRLRAFIEETELSCSA